MDSEKHSEKISESFFAEMKDTFFFQIHRIQKTIFRKGNQMFQEAKIDLQVEQFPILVSVAALDGVSQQKIAEVTRRDKSSIQRTLVALEKKGLVTVEQDTEDKRRNLVYATQDGKLLAVKLKKILKKAEEEVFKVITEDEKQAAMRSLKDVANKLEQE